MTAQGIFITGTDTGVGKTFVSAALLSVLRSRGVDAVPMKPVQTGATRRNGRWCRGKRYGGDLFHRHRHGGGTAADAI